jgi:hypothetical protein
VKRTILEGGVCYSIQCSRVEEEGKALRERKGNTCGIYLIGSSCLEVLVQGLRHKLAASSALGRHRNKR